MICKWCGEQISSTNRKCSRCGRDIPPLSDCGGFYDLTGKSTMRTMAPVSVPVDPIPELQKLGRFTQKQFQWQTRLIGICAAVNIALMLVLFIFVKAELNMIRAERKEIQSSEPIAVHDTTGEPTLGHNPPAESTSEPNTSEATWPTAGKTPQDTRTEPGSGGVDTQPGSSGIMLDVDIGDAQNVSCALFSDDVENKAEAILRCRDNGNCSISITEDGGTNVATFVINKEPHNVFLEVFPGEFLPDVDMSSLQFAWEYRFADEDVWQTPDEAIFSNFMSSPSIAYDAERLDGSPAELRCTVIGKCKDGIAVRLTLAGIRISSGNESNEE